MELALEVTKPIETYAAKLVKLIATKWVLARCRTKSDDHRTWSTLGAKGLQKKESVQKFILRLLTEGPTRMTSLQYHDGDIHFQLISSIRVSLLFLILIQFYTVYRWLSMEW